MKMGEDFRREFPQAEEGFRDAAFRTLQGLQEDKMERRMKYRPLPVLVLVLILMMGAGVAATWERWSLDDFIPTGRITATEEAWREMVAGFEPVTVHSAVAEVTVREALFDGYALYIVADVTPKVAGDFFMPEMTKLGSPASEASDSLPDDITVREYMALNGYTRAFEVSIYTTMSGVTFMPEMAVNEDGTMTFYLRQRLSLPRLQVEQLDMTLHMTICSAEGNGRYFVKAPLTIQRLPVLEEAVSAEGVRHEFANSGVALSNLRLVRTPLSTYVTADAEIIDEEAYQTRFGSYVLMFTDTNGAEYDAGPFNLMGFMRDPVDRNHAGPLYYTATLTLQELPDAIAVMEYPWRQYDPEIATDSWHVQLNREK